MRCNATQGGLAQRLDGAFRVLRNGLGQTLRRARTQEIDDRGDDATIVRQAAVLLADIPRLVPTSYGEVQRHRAVAVGTHRKMKLALLQGQRCDRVLSHTCNVQHVAIRLGPARLLLRRCDEEHDVSPYDDNGVDRSVVRWMLSLTPTERLAAVQSSIDVIMSVRELPDGSR